MLWVCFITLLHFDLLPEGLQLFAQCLLDGLTANLLRAIYGSESCFASLVRR